MLVCIAVLKQSQIVLLVCPLSLMMNVVTWAKNWDLYEDSNILQKWICPMLMFSRRYVATKNVLESMSAKLLQMWYFTAQSCLDEDVAPFFWTLGRICTYLSLKNRSLFPCNTEDFKAPNKWEILILQLNCAVMQQIHLAHPLGLRGLHPSFYNRNFVCLVVHLTAFLL